MQVGTFNKEKALIGAFYVRILWKLNNSAKFRCQLSSSLSSSGSGVAAGSAHSVGVAVSRGPETGVSVATPPPAGVCILQLHGCCHETRGFVTRDRVTVRVPGLVVRAGVETIFSCEQQLSPSSVRRVAGPLNTGPLAGAAPVPAFRDNHSRRYDHWRHNRWR